MIDSGGLQLTWPSNAAETRDVTLGESEGTVDYWIAQTSVTRTSELLRGLKNRAVDALMFISGRCGVCLQTAMKLIPMEAFNIVFIYQLLCIGLGTDR